MNTGPDPKTYLGLGVGVLIVSGVLCYLPYTKLNANKTEIAQLAPKVKPFNQVQSDLTASNAQLVADQNDLAHLEANVSSAAYVPSLLLDLNKFGQQCGIQVTGVHPQAVTAPPLDPKKKVASKPYDELTIDVSGKGTYRAALNFIQGLTMFPKIVEARTVTILPVSKDPRHPEQSSGLLNITVELRAFVFKQEETATPPATPATAGASATTTAPATPGARSTTPPPATAQPNSPQSTPKAPAANKSLSLRTPTGAKNS